MFFSVYQIDTNVHSSCNSGSLLFLPDDSHALRYVDNKNGSNILENLKANVCLLNLTKY